MLETVLVHLSRTQMESADYWVRRQREESDRWWWIEEKVIPAVERSGGELAEMTVAGLRLIQRTIELEQVERAVIRDRYADETEIEI